MFLTIGLMTGTSMDGIDAALLRTNGKEIIEELGFTSLKYDPHFQILLKAAEYTARNHNGNIEQIKKEYLTELSHYLEKELKLSTIEIQQKIEELNCYLQSTKNTKITFDDIETFSTHLHAEIIKKLLQQTNYRAEQIDVIGYHGQTLFHFPASRITLQIGNGKLLSQLTGITVVNNFRQNDVEAGGQGAPFAPLYHQALAVRDNKLPMAVINCGGIANITLISNNGYENLIGFDTGPGNGLIDRLIKQRTHGQEMMDKDGHYGVRGKIHLDIVEKLFSDAVQVGEKNYFTLKPPKSLDIGDLKLIPELDQLSLEDACATLEAFTAESIVRSLDFVEVADLPKHWVLAGGGWNNPVILRELKQRLINKIGSQVLIQTADQIGWNSQALEAQIFAYLAVRSLQGLPISFPSLTHVPQPLCGGEVYFPERI